MRNALISLAALLAATAAAAPASAQTNGPVPGPYGTEDGYGGDGIGWGPAYRPQTNFRPAYGFYGGVERPYPYARYPEATGSLGRGPQAVSPRRLAVRKGRSARVVASRRAVARTVR